MGTFGEMVHFIPHSQRRIAMLAAQADNAPALIFGGSGSGKGAIARWIHKNGPRAAGPLLVAKHETSLASQIPQAHGGTLVISEIGEWPLGEQKILLNYLLTKSVPATGQDSSKEVTLRKLVNVRIVATASHHLEGRAQAGLFNFELLEKLSVFRIDMPALSRRPEEFDDIVLGILGEITHELHKEHIRTMSEDSWKRLRGYEWPGNLRELRNVLRMAVISSQGDAVEATDLPDFGHDRIDFRATREQFEKIYLVELLKTCEGKIDKTCEVGRIDKDTLLAKIERYRIREVLQVS